MPERSAYDYAVIRVVPRVDREEFLNAGVLLFCLKRDFLDARIELDVPLLLALAPSVDVDLVQSHLAAIPRLCAGGPAAGQLGALSQKERFHWLVAPRSTVVQTSPVHSGLCEEPAAMLDHLLAAMVRRDPAA